MTKVATVLDTCETEFGKPVQSVKEITSIPNPDKSVLLADFGGGLKLKLCISTAADYRFDAATQFTDVIKAVRFPKILLRGEGWVAFEWIEGTPVSDFEFSNQLLEQATSVLRAIHETKIQTPPDVLQTTLDDVRLKLQKHVPLLISEGIISQTQSDSIAAAHNSLRPQSVNISLIHGDFSPTNLVVCENELWVVDNEKMRVHIIDYDICRAATFWDEFMHCGQTLLDTYKHQSRLQFDPVSLRFWEIYDLVYRISYRLSACAERNDFCIMKLRRILTTGVSS